MLFNVYGDNAIWQLLGCVLVFVALIVLNEIARRSKAGGLALFVVVPVILTIYFIVVAVCAKKGIDWAVNNQSLAWAYLVPAAITSLLCETVQPMRAPQRLYLFETESTSITFCSMPGMFIAEKCGSSV